MYRTATYALGYIIADLPMITLGTLVFSFSFYWFTGLQRDFGKFAFYTFVTLVRVVQPYGNIIPFMTVLLTCDPRS